MKKITFLFTGLILISGLVFGQAYYYIPNLSAGQNPGGLNNDDENPTGGLPVTWTTILGSSAAPTWSPNQTIPFSFNFDGLAVTEYKVSSSGVLTFNTSAASVPGHANDYIPSASIPDKSVMVWGIQGTGSNDGIATKTFGAPPNRQHWVFFASYTLGDYAYWSIVLEEGTDKIYMVNQRNHPDVTDGITVGIQVDGTTAVSVLGSPEVLPIAGNDLTPADNGYYEFIYGVQATLDLEGTSITMDDIAVYSEGAQTVTGTLTNFGSGTITSLDLNWQVLGTSIATETITGLNILPYNSYSYSHSDQWTPIATGTYDVSVWASNINGSPDENTSNDTVTKAISVVSAVTDRMTLYEVFTSSTCGPCVAGNANLDAIFGSEPEAGPHAGKWAMVKYQMSWPGSGDPYYTLEGNTRKSFYSVTGVPNLEIDGLWGQNPSTLGQTTVNDYQNTPSFLEITADYTITGQTVDVNININPIAEVPAFFSNDLTLHIAVVEKETFLNTGTNGETNFLFVMKKMLPNASGTALGSLLVGSPQDFNESYTFNGSYVLPPDANSPINHAVEHSVEEFGDLMVVAWVQDMGNKVVHQSAWAELNCSVSSSVTSTDASCGLNDGQATVTVSGGAVPLTYQWDDPASQTTATANSLTVGVYNVVVTDGLGCITQGVAEISETGSANVSGITVDNTCFDGNAGLASAMASGGTAPYTYLWSNGATTSNITDLFNGNYYVSVTE